MESLRIIISGLAIFLFIFEWYLLLTEKNTRWMFVNYPKNWILCLELSFVLSVIGVLSGYFMYNKLDVLLLFISSINLLFLVIKVIVKVLKRNKKENVNEFIEVKAGTYSILSNAEYANKYKIKNLMKIEAGAEEKYVMFNGIPPELNKDLILNCIKTNNDYYICNTFMYQEKKKFINIIRIIFNYYVMFTATYGGSLGVSNYLNNIQDEKSEQLLGVSIAYAIFSFGSASTKYGKDSFTKFLHIQFLIFYIIVAIEILFVWFI